MRLPQKNLEQPGLSAATQPALFQLLPSRIETENHMDLIQLIILPDHPSPFGGDFVNFRKLILPLSLLLATLALAQDVPTPCYPCAPEPDNGCAACHPRG